MKTYRSLRTLPRFSNDGARAKIRAAAEDLMRQNSRINMLEAMQIALDDWNAEAKRSRC